MLTLHLNLHTYFYIGYRKNMIKTPNHYINNTQASYLNEWVKKKSRNIFEFSVLESLT